MAWSHYCMGNGRGKGGSSDKFPLFDSKITVDSDYRPWNQRTIAFCQESDDKPRQCVEKQRHYSAVMLKLQYSGHLMRTDDSLKKSLMLEKMEGKRRRWHQRMRRLDSITDAISMNPTGQTPEDGEGQGGLACCSPWGCKESDMTGQLNNNNPQMNQVLEKIVSYSKAGTRKV